jgi:putative solute:sodium symporter small subunit
LIWYFEAKIRISKHSCHDGGCPNLRVRSKNSILPLNSISADMPEKNLKRYWRTNLSYLAILLSAWFLVSFLFGIVWVEELNTIRLGGFKLGFWFAQQGSIYAFVIIILIYIRLMNRLDRKYNVNE